MFGQHKGIVYSTLMASVLAMCGSCYLSHSPLDKNLCDFDDADVMAALDALAIIPRPPSVGGTSRVAAVQLLLDKAGSQPSLAEALQAHVRRVCEAEGNANRFLSRRLVGGNRNSIECAWHTM